MRGRRSGFTLLEILVVMVIVAILVAAATLSIGATEVDRLKQERQRLQALVMLLRDEAVFQSRSYGIRFVENGYAFLVVGDQAGQWFGVPDQQFRSRELPRPMLLQVYRDGIDLDLTLPEKDDEGDQRILPHAFIFSSGEVTPFEVEFVFPSKGKQRVRFDALGNSQMVEQ